MILCEQVYYDRRNDLWVCDLPADHDLPCDWESVRNKEEASV